MSSPRAIELEGLSHWYGSGSTRRQVLQGVELKVAPGDHFIKLCHDELIGLMGPVDSELRLKTKPVSAVMMVGLQGSGKTTTAAKLARLLP